MKKKRVVITGMGAISPIGNTPSNISSALKNGQSGIKAISHFPTNDFPVRFAGLVENFTIEQVDYDQKILSKADPFIHYGLAAALDAVKQSRLDELSAEKKKGVGVIMGSGIGGLHTIETQYDVYLNKGPKKISPFFIPSTIVNMTSGHIAIRHGFGGPNLAISTACTTGTHCICTAYDLIKLGRANVMIAGGSEKASTLLGMGGFAAARALSTRNDEPTKASRPWDLNRDGFVLADGAGALVLEELEHALERNAPILGELIGAGYSADAFHMTQPHPEGEGAIRSMELALADAGIQSGEVDYINAHGTSTPLGDLAEIEAIRKVFKGHEKSIAISSTKSMTGHLLGAAGALEAVISLLAIQESFLPPTINLDDPEPSCADLNLIPHRAQLDHKISIVLSNSFGFGGTNGSLIFKKYE